MEKKEIFSSNIRKVWDDEREEWFFSVVDAVGFLSGSSRPRKYWVDLKIKLELEGNQLSDIIGQLKILAPDGKMRETDINVLGNAVGYLK